MHGRRAISDRIASDEDDFRGINTDVVPDAKCEGIRSLVLHDEVGQPRIFVGGSTREDAHADAIVQAHVHPQVLQ